MAVLVFLQKSRHRTYVFRLKNSQNPDSVTKRTVKQEKKKPNILVTSKYNPRSGEMCTVIK